MISNKLTALSVLDGRYAKLTANLNDIFSEYGLVRQRIYVEIQWLLFLIEDLRVVQISATEIENIRAIAKNFSVKEAAVVKEIEQKTNHDVKAVEYYIKDQLIALGLDEIIEWVHFACTSEDINNNSYARMLTAGRSLMADLIKRLLLVIETYGRIYKAIPMMSRTHGQPASPTTIGKEFINFAWRIREELECLMQIEMQGKMNGATGNFNAHHFVFPKIDWIAASRRFLATYLNLKPLCYTTQINPYSYISRLLHSMIRIASMIVDLDRDMWGYISLGYFKQKLREGEVGSSTMPHKVNPIDFENSEGNMGIAIAMMEHLAVKLLNSRFQRDLTDSTVLRNLGALFGYFQIGLLNTIKGLDKIDVDVAEIQKDLQENWALLSEAVQTAMRVFGEENPYEKLKELTRGKKIAREDLSNFFTALQNVPSEVKLKMEQMTVSQYVGLAEQLVDHYFLEISSKQ